MQTSGSSALGSGAKGRSAAAAAAQLSWDDGLVMLRVVSEGTFLKRSGSSGSGSIFSGSKALGEWKLRKYKLREDSQLFYFDENDRAGGCIDVSVIRLELGPDSFLVASTTRGFSSPDRAIAVSLTVKGTTQRVYELLFDNKNSLDTFCLAVSKVSVNHNVEDFIVKFHWMTANREMGLDNASDSPIASVSNPSSNFSFTPGPGNGISTDSGLSNQHTSGGNASSSAVGRPPDVDSDDDPESEDEAEGVMAADEKEREERRSSDLQQSLKELASGKKLSWEDGLSLRIVGEGSFWRKRTILRSWKKRVYRLREDGVLFFFDGASVKGTFDVSAVQLALGDPRNISHCGAINPSSNEAVPITIHALTGPDAGSSKDGDILDIIFDNKVAARLFLGFVAEVSKKHNVDDMIRSVDAIDDAFYSALRRMEEPEVSDTTLVEGNFWKRSKVRDIVKKRVYRIALKRPDADPQDFKGCIEFDLGENGILKSSFPLYNTVVQFEDSADGKKGNGDFYENELIGIKIFSCSLPLAKDNSNISSVLASSKKSVVMLLEGVRSVEAVCLQLDKVSHTSNVPQFVDLLKSKTITREKARSMVLGSVANNGSTTTQAARKLVPNDVKVIYEGVFLTRTSDSKRWKRRNFALKRGFTSDSARDEFSKHGIEGVSDRSAVVSTVEFVTGALGGSRERWDVGEIGLSINTTLPGPPVKSDQHSLDYTIIDINLIHDNRIVSVLFFGRTDVEQFCLQLAKVSHTNNVRAFLDSFHASPQGSMKKKCEALLAGSLLRLGLSSAAWKRKHYRLCRIRDDTGPTTLTYGILKFCPIDNAECSLNEMPGYITLDGLTVDINDDLIRGSHTIVMTTPSDLTSGKSGGDVAMTHSSIIFILDPFGVRKPHPEEMQEFPLSSLTSRPPSGTTAIPPAASPGNLKKPTDPNRTHASLEEISMFLKCVAELAPASNAKAALKQLRARVRAREDARLGFVVSVITSTLVLFTLTLVWLCFYPSYLALLVLFILTGLLGAMIQVHMVRKKSIEFASLKYSDLH